MLRLRLCWRNLWRNRRRTAINLAAMSLSCALLMLALGFIGGLRDQLVGSVTGALCGDAQVHAPGFRSQRNLQTALEPAEVEALGRAARAQGVAAAPRAIGYGLLAHGSRSAGVELVGVDPAREREFGGLPERVAAGAFLGARPERRAVLGQRLARTLEARPGDELVAVVQAADGSMGSLLLVVGGVLDAVAEEQDRTLAMIDRRDFAELFATEAVHEVALTSHRALPSEGVAALAHAAAPRAETRAWRELLPQVAMLERLYAVEGFLLGVIFSIAAGLGVLNAMLMGQYERIPEFGLLKALGATPGRIVLDVLLEALLLGLLALGLGVALGGALLWKLQQVGIPLASGGERLTAAGVAFVREVRPDASLSVFVQPVLVTLATALLAAVIPALRAARLRAVEALAHV